MSNSSEKDGGISRRGFLRAGALVFSGLGFSGLLARRRAGAAPVTAADQESQTGYGSHAGHGDAFSMVGTVDPARNGFDPMWVLVDWDYGKVSRLPSGQVLREYNFEAIDKEIEIGPGITFPAWTYNGRVPGPTIRCAEGDRIRLHFTNNGNMPHTIHFHGIHPFAMDGVAGAGPGEIGTGQSFTYEFDAEPFGCHLYHCHTVPLKRHLHKGLYGAFIVDPLQGRQPMRELMMVMNGFDTNFDSENEVYAINSVGFEYQRRMIPIKVGEKVRVYLINLTEFDPINSFHLHAEFFDYYDHGTTLEPTHRKIDTVMQCQAQRGFLEFSFRWPGQYMFHAHQSEFAELGWMAHFNVVEEKDFPSALTAVGLNAQWDLQATRGNTVSAGRVIK
jgi:FtsP/CotA-like multicopper oxidase with cupredoxin domain